MAQIIRLKIDVKKMIREALYKGEKGTYLDATLFLEDGMDEFGQCGRIVQDLGKDRRAAGEKGPILGNAKHAGQSGQQQQRQAPQQATQRKVDRDDDLDF